MLSANPHVHTYGATEHKTSQNGNTVCRAPVQRLRAESAPQPSTTTRRHTGGGTDTVMDTTSAAAAGIAPHNTNNAALLSQDDTQAFQPHEFPFADDLVLAGANDGWEIDRETVQEGMVPAPTDSHLAWQCEGAAGRNDDVANGCSAAPVTAHTPVHESGVVRVHSAPTQAVSTVRAREPRPVVDIDRFMSGSSVLVGVSSFALIPGYPFVSLHVLCRRLEYTRHGVSCCTIVRCSHTRTTMLRCDRLHQTK